MQDIFGTDTYTVAGNGAVIFTAHVASRFSIQVVGTAAAATAWNVRLEGGLDGVNFTTILTHTDITGDGVMLFSGATQYPARYIRSRCVSLTLGSATDIVVYICGVQ